MTIAESPNRAAPGDALDRVLADPEVRAASRSSWQTPSDGPHRRDQHRAAGTRPKPPHTHEQSLLPERHGRRRNPPGVDYSESCDLRLLRHAFER